jgi:hypothetical protein
MHYHPHLAARLAETRAASLRAAARARPQPSGRRGRSGSRPTLAASPVALNSYPRLCGLPVTVERLPIRAGRSQRNGEPGAGVDKFSGVPPNPLARECDEADFGPPEPGRVGPTRTVNRGNIRGPLGAMPPNGVAPRSSRATAVGKDRCRGESAPRP